MALTDSQLVGLFEFLIAHEKDMMVLKSHVLALETIAVRLAGDDVRQQLYQESQALLDSKSFDDSRKRIAQFEQAIAQLLPSSGVN